MWRIPWVIAIFFALWCEAKAQQQSSLGPPNGIACAYNSSLPTIVSGNPGWVQCDSAGRLVIAPGSSSAPVFVAPVPVTPAAATASAIVTGGTALTTITAPVNGCYITNPLTASDQNISAAEVLYINPVTTATANGRGTNSALQPGQSWACPGPLASGANISAIAATSSHAFSVVVW